MELIESIPAAILTLFQVFLVPSDVFKQGSKIEEAVGLMADNKYVDPSMLFF